MVTVYREDVGYVDYEGDFEKSNLAKKGFVKQDRPVDPPPPAAEVYYTGEYKGLVIVDGLIKGVKDA